MENRLTEDKTVSVPLALEGPNYPTKSSWRSIFRWYWPTSPEYSLQSEQSLFEEFGGVSFGDTDHVAARRVYLKAPKDLPPNQSNPRFINTLILDPQDVQTPASERLSIIFCHGFGAGLGFFYRNLSPINRLIPNARIYAVDLLGMGRSGRPEFPKFQLNIKQDTTQQAIDFFIDSLEEWRGEQKGLEKFVLVGHSMGGYIAALYALRHPDKVQKLILASPVGLPERPAEGATAVTGHTVPGFLTHLWNANYTPQSITRALGPIGPRFALGYVNNRFPHLNIKERNTLGQYLYHISADVGSGEYALAALLSPGAWAREPLHNRLSAISMPTTFIYGAEDWMDRRHAEAAATKMNVPVRILSVPNSGHNLFLDNYDAFNKVIASEILDAAGGTTTKSLALITTQPPIVNRD